MPDAYLSCLPPERQEELARVNAPGLKALREALAGGDAIAFLGAGVSAPLYPLWTGVIDELVSSAADSLTKEAAATCRAMAASSPDAVVEIVRRELGVAQYRDVLREVFRVRQDPYSGRTWTPTHELIARCNFAGVVTTNYDPGIVNARMAVRPGANSTGFTSYTDDAALDRWRRREVFGEEELPVLFAHGHHNQPDAIVLATTEYRKAYGGKLADVLAQLMDAARLVWIGFSFADQQIAAILREINVRSGTREEPGAAPRHVAVMPWDPGAGGAMDAHDPEVLRGLSEIQYASRLVLYPAPQGDHSALRTLLEALVEPRFAPAGAPRVPGDEPESPAEWKERWVHGGTPAENFTGREEELARLERWAGDEEVNLIGVTAWGGAGKTALVTEWLTRRGGARAQRPLQGLFAWSFYENPSADEWAISLTAWMQRTFDVIALGGAPAARAVAACRYVPVGLVLDGLEVVQEGPAGAQFGRLLDGTLRDVLTQLCATPNHSLVVLTSRFPFADLEQFDGRAARMLDVPPLTPAEGANALARGGGDWLSESDRLDLVAAVDGHALAVAALAGALRERPPAGDVRKVIMELESAGRTNARVTKALAFYAQRLGGADQDLVALVSLFQRPVRVDTILALGSDERIGHPLRDSTAADVEAAVRQRLSGLLSWHPDRTVSAHPLVREAFRPRVLSADSAQLAVDAALSGLPESTVRSRSQALQVVEMIELLLDAGEWTAADDLYQGRLASGTVWKHLPAAQLGVRCGLAFVGTPARRDSCRSRLTDGRLRFYLGAVGLVAFNAGDFTTAVEAIRGSANVAREQHDSRNLSIALAVLSECHWRLGDAHAAETTANEAFRAVEADDTAGGPKQDALRCLAVASQIAGDTVTAERRFLATDVFGLGGDPQGRHLYSVEGTLWATFLALTGRIETARQVTEASREIAEEHGWNEDVARCDRLLGGLVRRDDSDESAAQRLEDAVATFRDGDYVTELAEALVDLAEHHRRCARLEVAESTASDAVMLAGPRSLVPTHAAALCVRARARADGPTDRGRARDDADAALRLATVVRRLPWQELDAMEAHAHIDRCEGRDNGWAARAAQLRLRLVPPGLDPDPLATAQAEAARTKRE